MRESVNILTQIASGTDTPLFIVEECDFGIICKSVNCESIYWYDNKGSVGKFYNFLGLEKNSAILKEKKLNDTLLEVSIDNVSEIKESIAELLTLLDIGTYDVDYLKANEEPSNNGYNYYNIVFPKYDIS